MKHLKFYSILTVISLVFGFAVVNADAPTAIRQGGTATTTAQTNGIWFYDGTTFKQDLNNLVWSISNGRFGVSTSTPGSTLSVGGITNFTTATSTFYGSGGINLSDGCFAIDGTCVGGTSQDPVTLAGSYDYITLSGQQITRGQIDLTTDITGTLPYSNGGTGTSTPALWGDVLYWNGSNWQGLATTSLGISGGSGYTNLTEFVDQTAWRLFYSNGSGDVTELALGTDGQVLTSTGASTAPAFEDAAGSSPWTTSGSNIYYNTGNVGISTSSPYAKLSVAGLGVFNNINATSTNATSTFATNAVFSGINTEIYNLRSGALSFPADAGIVSLVDVPVTSSSADNTVISYTSQIDGSPVLTVYGQSNGSGGVDNLRVGVSTTTPWRTLSVDGTVAFDNLTSSESGTTLCILSNNDVVSSGVTDSCTSSSKRFKHDIKTITSGMLEKVLKLRPVTFMRNEPPASHKGVEIGFIAEDVVEIFPELIEYEADGVTPRGINYGGLVSPLAGAIQEQQAQIDDLQKQINAINREKQGVTPFNIVLLIAVIGLGVLVIKKK